LYLYLVKMQKPEIMLINEMEIEIKELVKKYRNGNRALKDVDLKIERSLFGLLGPNEAVKTTLMRILVTLM